jgi:hypothetical protein
MLMRFYFGLGVGHVYSHYRPTQPEPEGAAHAAFTHDVEDVGQIDEVEDEEDSEDDEDEDDDTKGGSDVERWFSSSNESLLGQFDEMYDSEVDLDYEN